MDYYTKLRERFLPGEIYTYKQTLKLINGTQSSVAAYVLQDLLANGILQEVQRINGHPAYRCNQ